MLTVSSWQQCWHMRGSACWCVTGAPQLRCRSSARLDACRCRQPLQGTNKRRLARLPSWPLCQLRQRSTLLAAAVWLLLHRSVRVVFLVLLTRTPHRLCGLVLILPDRAARHGWARDSGEAGTRPQRPGHCALGAAQGPRRACLHRAAQFTGALLPPAALITHPHSAPGDPTS